MESRKTSILRKVTTAIYGVVLAVCLATWLRPVEATTYEISGKIEIPKIQLESDVTITAMKEHSLETPDEIVGAFSRARNNTFLFGHSSGVFANLDKVTVGDEVDYDNKKYVVTSVGVVKKSEIIMSKLLSEREVETLTIMTCAGEPLSGGDATHRLILTAVKI